MVPLIYIMLCLIWGSTWMAIRIGLTDAPPLTAASLRFMLALSVLAVIVKFRKAKLPATWSQRFALGYPGLFMFGANYALVYFAEQYISSALTSVLFASFPLFVAFFARYYFRSERLSKAGWVGLGLGMIGVTVISVNSLQTSGGLFLGSMLALGGSMVCAYGVIIHRHRFSHEDIFVASSVQMAMGGSLLLISSLIFEDWSDFAVTASSVGSIVYLAIPGTVVTFAGYFWLLKQIRVVTSSLIAFITPAIAIFIGVGLFDEPLPPEAIGGTVLILSGVFLTMGRRSKPEAEISASITDPASSP